MSSLNLFQTNKEPENPKTQVFENAEFGKIRVKGDSENPLFCLKDICENLEIQNVSDIASAIKREFGDGVDLIYPIIDSLGREQKAIFISEPQLYFVLMRSDKPKAKPFRLWVTKEVLPAIRKTGAYKIQKQETLISADFLRKIADEMEKKDLKISLLENQIESEKPLVEFSKQIATSANAISVRDFAKILYDENIKMGEKQLFHWLRLCGYLTSENMPYQRYLGAGYFEVKQKTYKTPYGEKSYTQTLITGKGQIYFCEKLRKEFK